MASLPTHARGNLRAQLELFAGADAPKCDRAPSGRILILAPHMDDESFGCGGTMATAVAMGAKITVVFLTNGNKGYEPERTANFSSAKVAEFEEALTITRKQEAQSACSALGISDFEFLDFPDSALSVSDVSVRRLQEVILRVKPEDIFLPFFCDPHPDHIITNQLLMACIQDSCKAQIRCWGYEIWNPVSANVIVDITTHIGEKIRDGFLFKPK